MHSRSSTSHKSPKCTSFPPYSPNATKKPAMETKSEYDSRSDDPWIEKKYDNLDYVELLVSPSAPKTQPKGNEESDNAAETERKNDASFLWGLWQCDDEVTFLLEENDLHRFPDDALIVSPQRWRVIKLSGRSIGFNEV